MRQLGILLSIFVLFGTFRAGTQAQPLALLQTVNGHIAVDTQAWTVNAQAGQVLSARLEMTNSDFAPQIEWLDSTGKTLLKGSKVQNKILVLENLIIPSRGDYTLQVSTTNEGSGDYTLTLLPGYGALLLNDSMDGGNHWRLWKQDTFNAQFDTGKLRLEFTADNRFTWTTSEQLGALPDVYLQADVHIERESVYSEFGLMIRGAVTDGGLSFYAFMVNNDGKYRFVYSTPARLTILQDWTALDAPTASDATLGLLAQSDRFALFYNGQRIASVSNGASVSPGAVGLLIGTGKAPSSTVSVLFDNVIITAPNGASSIRLPSTLKEAQRGPELIIKELQAAALLSSAGKPAGTLSQTYLRNYSDSLVLQKLPKQFTDVLFIADVSWDTTQEGVACGLAVRYSDDDNFTILYIDRKGGYGVRQVKNGRAVVSSYDLSEAIKTPNLAGNRLIVVAAGDTLTLYVNGTLLAHLRGESSTGSLAVASYNYAPASARCQFDNVIAYSFDP